VDDLRKYEKRDVDSIFAGVGSCAQISLRLAKFGATQKGSTLSSKQHNTTPRDHGIRMSMEEKRKLTRAERAATIGPLDRSSDLPSQENLIY
jgi:hypothetical protein